ncbi:high-potential iron-sulfur protein [Endozoicomonas sp. ALD040]|uniref:high-potential iron-sulfur protein n=1 Tax=unclassified Endozoicomonas TaxID=2644528 RepID=UPI003BB1B0D3
MDRRKFMQLGLACTLIPLVAMDTVAEPAAAGEVQEDDPQAKALNYVKEASEAKGNPKYKEGDICKNCMFFEASKNNGCTLFAGRRVEEGGWCTAWVAKPK